MLPWQYRLRTENDIGVVLRSRRQIGVSFILYWRPNRLPYCRFGLLVSKKIIPKATGRNLIKRRLRAMVAQLFPRLTPGYDCVLKPRNPAVTKKTYQELQIELTTQLEKIGLLKKLL